MFTDDLLLVLNNMLPALYVLAHLCHGLCQQQDLLTYLIQSGCLPDTLWCQSLDLINNAFRSGTGLFPRSLKVFIHRFFELHAKRSRSQIPERLGVNTNSVICRRDFKRRAAVFEAHGEGS